MTIQQCRYILKIAQCGSFNEAARQLYIAQSSLSVGVKALEQELNIKIFERSGSGVYLTEAGAEFIRYARQIVEQNDFVRNSYISELVCKHLFVTTQHYDLVADTFGKLIRQTQEPNYRFSLREVRTYEVIHETQNGSSDIGVIAIKSNDYSIMERYLSKKELEFTPVIQVKPHVFLRKNHPLAVNFLIKPEELKDYPYICYEQGEHNATFFAEEIADTYSSKQVEISDRATLMGILLNTDCYTIGTGIMPSRLNQGRIISIPYQSKESYTVGYLLRKDRYVSELVKTFIQMFTDAAQKFRDS